ncbi:DUF1900-domain-containing protein [Polyporus arcularius HHB13444]|uniref:DUF1900-domain-containing protein n=1 Tax=Polyporus arcularius HHB13444 TaxID=1314778 RepID=A0A5C3NS47_9APHY|nr:DUF1900-domain-containing protein [Polyporus arcularius HHB13444]
MGDKDRIATTGFSKMSDRQVALWETGSLSNVKTITIDQTSGVLMPFWTDNNILFLAGKGDGNIRYYEYENDNLFPLAEHKSSDPQRGMCFLPRRGLSVSDCEIARALKVAANSIEAIAFIVPRKSDSFQSDIFPPAPSAEPALTAAEFFSGKTAPPKLVSLDDGSVFSASGSGSAPAPASTPAPAPTRTVFALAASAALAHVIAVHEEPAPAPRAEPTRSHTAPQDDSTVSALKEENEKLAAELREARAQIRNLELQVETVSEQPSSAAPSLPEDRHRPGLAVQNVTRSALTASQVRAERVTHRVDLHQHIQDVLAVLHHASVLISYDRQKPVYALNDGELALWIHKRCHRTILRRVAAGKRAWPDHGLGAALESWTPEEYDRLQIKAGEIRVPDDYWGVLQYCGLKSKTLDFDTAPNWIGALGRILSRLEGMFVLDPVNHAPVLKDSAGKLNALLAALNYILNIPQVKSVIKRSSLPTHVARIVEGSETERERMWSYLQTLAAWHVAAASLVAHLRKLGRAPKATVIQLIDRSAEAVRDIRCNYSAVIDHVLFRVRKRVQDPAEHDSAIAWVKARAQTTVIRTTQIRVHAEAALMALAAELSFTDNTDCVPEDDNVLPIGVSDKCCFMCYHLSSVLFGHDDHWTHGRIFPWDPPQFGVPASAMGELVEMLVNQVLLHAERHGQEAADASQQLSPHSDAENTTVSNVVLEGFDPYEED